MFDTTQQRIGEIELCFSGSLTTKRCVIVLGRTQQAKKSEGIGKILNRFSERGYCIIWLDRVSGLTPALGVANDQYEKILATLSTTGFLRKALQRKTPKRIIKLGILLSIPSFWQPSSLVSFLNLMNPFEQLQIRLSGNLRAKKLEEIEKVLPSHEIIIVSASSGCRACAIPHHLKNINAMICFGYPFKNKKIKALQAWRTQPLASVNKPFFIFQGNEDEYFNAAEAAAIPKSALVVLKSVHGTHDYHDLSAGEIDQVFATLRPYVTPQ